MTINMTTVTYPVKLSVTEQPIKLTISNLMYQAQGSGTSGAVNSVNGKAGNVILTPADVGADIAGAAQTVSDVLQPQITLNTDAVAMLTALLSALQSAKADVSYVNAQIATLVGADTQTLAAINAISDALSDNEDLLSALDQTVANRVRFDVATQGLTALQKYNARTNIGAEESGTAAQLISQITATSIGAVTASQLANVAFSGSYNDLSNKPSITGALLTGLTSVSAAAISATDSIIGALAKLQANVDTKADATNTLALINSKVSSVLLGVANGVATLGSDGKLTAAQVPAASGGSGTDDKITWTTVTSTLTTNVASGFADNSNQLMVGKDKNGVIYVKGVFRNTSSVSAVSSGTGSMLSLFNLPSTHQVKGFSNNSTTYTLFSVRYTDQSLPQTPNTSGYYCRLQVYQGVQTFGVSGSMGMDVICYIPPQAIGVALNP